MLGTLRQDESGATWFDRMEAVFFTFFSVEGMALPLRGSDPVKTRTSVDPNLVNFCPSKRGRFEERAQHGRIHNYHKMKKYHMTEGTRCSMLESL